MIERSRERIEKTSEVFTPDWLVNEMLQLLYDSDPLLFTVPEKTFLDPACGDGNIIIEILKWKIRFNQTELLSIVKSIYGIDIMEDNINSTKKRIMDIIRIYIPEQEIETYMNILNTNIICYDSLKWDWKKWCSIENDLQEYISFS